MIHLASPWDMKMKEEEIVNKALTGTNAVLSSCLENGVKKLVVTSSTVTIVPCHAPKKHYNESDTVNHELKKNSAYTKSKILAENAVFKFAEELSEESELQILTINPSFVVGKTCGIHSL